MVAAHIKSEPVSGLLTVPVRRGDIDGWRASLAYDRLDDADFPHDGQALRLESFQTWSGAGATGGYRRGDLEAELARSAGAHGLHLRGRWAQASGSNGAMNSRKAASTRAAGSRASMASRMARMGCAHSGLRAPWANRMVAFILRPSRCCGSRSP